MNPFLAVLVTGIVVYVLYLVVTVALVGGSKKH